LHPALKDFFKALQSVTIYCFINSSNSIGLKIIVYSLSNIQKYLNPLLPKTSMQISVIASGSNGNCCFVEEKDTSILIDAGKSCREIEERLNRLGKSLENLNAILLTHAHTDHVSGAGIISRKYNIPIYLSKETFRETKSKIGDFERKTFNSNFNINNLNITPIKTSHIIPSNGFIINKFGLFTDTGVITKELADSIKHLKAVLIESNHDIDMLINGHYPPHLKQWILSDLGHLSNIDASNLIKEKGNHLSFILLGHLSGNNNTPEKAKETFETIVKNKLNYEVCSREKETGCWEI